MSKKDNPNRLFRGLPACIIIAIITIVISLAIIYKVKSTEIVENEANYYIESAEDPILDDPIQYDYQWDDRDYQDDYPEESAAVYILLRANGYEDIYKDKLASIPTDNNASTISESLNRIVNGISDSFKVAVPIEGQNLLFVPAPSMIWIDNNGDTYPVVFLYADESTATISNPRNGIETYPFSVFHNMYDNADRQCIYIADRGYSTQ